MALEIIRQESEQQAPETETETKKQENGKIIDEVKREVKVCWICWWD